MKHYSNRDLHADVTCPAQFFEVFLGKIIFRNTHVAGN